MTGLGGLWPGMAPAHAFGWRAGGTWLVPFLYHLFTHARVRFIRACCACAVAPPCCAFRTGALQANGAASPPPAATATTTGSGGRGKSVAPPPPAVLQAKVSDKQKEVEALLLQLDEAAEELAAAR